MPNVTVVLDDRDIIELKAILLDHDGQEALRFLKRVIPKQVEAAHHKGMRNHLDQGQR
jgi:hypothetical protein